MAGDIDLGLLTRPAPTSTPPGAEGIAGASPTMDQPSALARQFRMIVFDWDGTAVTNRQEDASALARLAEPLLAAGRWLVVVTGTSFHHIERQFCDLVSPDCRHRLVVCANRGSEVFGFDEQGKAVLRSRRVATPDEDRALTAITEEVRDELVEATHLDIEIVYNRLNRRKIDLIPLPEWADPPKAEIGALREAVEARLARAGWRGGIARVVERTERVAADKGIVVRITSDVKHVEVGLTDKADAIAWIKRELMAPQGIGEDAVLVVGDEFGAIGGFPGSDDRLRAGLEAAPVVSVGAEPSGAPAGVLHLGGGPRGFRVLLAHQIARWRPPSAEGHGTLAPADERRLAPFFRASSAANEQAGWALTARGFRPELEHVIESLLAVGNGFLGVRGSLEVPHPASRPGTLVAGLFGVMPEPPAVPALAPAPDWLRLRLFADGDRIAVGEAGAADTLTLTRTLDLRNGLMRSHWAATSRGAKSAPPVTVRTIRLASQVRRGIGIQVVSIEATAAATITLQTWIEPPAQGLEPCDPHAAGSAWRTSDGTHALGCRVHVVLSTDGRALPPVQQRGVEGTRTWAWEAKPGQVATLVRIVSFARGGQAEDVDRDARAQLDAACAAGAEALIAEHVRAWHDLWEASDIRISGDDTAQRQMRFAIYHLLSAANPSDEHVSIGARGLTGDGYLGHVFWDTDVFLIPFYTAVWPAAARALLMYRYHTLPAARARAAQLGYQGALYAWESAETGADVTPPEVLGPDGQPAVIRCGTQEQHISADVAYAVWRYWSFTHDRGFLLAAGAEIILETARFWASRAALEEDGRYHIRHVIGPDEYHEDVDDNAYTNGMARWNLDCALAVARLMGRRWPKHWRALTRRLALGDDELAHWRDVSARLVSGIDQQGQTREGPDSERSLLIEQFPGFFDLEPIDLRAYAARTVPMDVVLGLERTRNTQVIKQADVVMLLALLPDQFTRRRTEANYTYYEERCGHGSSLSPAIHALVGARLGDLETAERYFHQSAEIDLNEHTGAAARGVHMAALGGFWSVVAFGFAGIWSRQAGLRLDPHLPDGWAALEIPLQWRGRRLTYRIQAEPPRITVQLGAGSPPMTVIIDSLHHRLRGDGAGVQWESWWDDATERWKEKTP